MASTEEIDDCRYAITDLLDDLAGSTDQSERLFIATELVRGTGELAFTISGSWGGGGSGWHAALRQRHRGSARLRLGLREVLDGRIEPLVAVVDEVVAQVGGRLWAATSAVETP
ncbi:hypothetical protein [Streptomyces chryseus]|uniref:Uncharacterized protein n=1 Tax=Streptomyces chryseus TaxID=68186 RepID=A0ABQ3E4V9_9ACTN|nr:hypothetical protein GCM10010346_57700 [Streptomyces chryseus]